MIKPRITKIGALWTCRAPLRPGLGFGLTPTDAYRNWLLDAQRPVFSPTLAPMHEPVAPWPAYRLPQYTPARHFGIEPLQPPYTVTCRH